MLDPSKVPWPKSEDEFRRLVEKVEAELQAEEIPIAFREMEALRRISGELHAELIDPKGQKSQRGLRKF